MLYYIHTETNEVISEDDLRDLYDGYLNEEGLVTIAGITFDPSRVLAELDPIAYRVGFHDFLDAEGYDEATEDEVERYG